MIGEDRDVSMGVFALQDIKAGELIFKDRTVIGICDIKISGICDNCHGKRQGEPFNVLCCGVKFRSTECRDKAMGSYHPPLCQMDISQEEAPNGVGYMRDQLVKRFLAIRERDRECHPLQQPFVYLMVANYNDREDVFLFEQCIVKPNYILHQLGINIFQICGTIHW